ncbi:MAG: PAS domain S-box protein [archaeon]
MSDSATVLCFSEDSDQLDRLVAPLEWSYPNVSVMHTDSSAAAIEHLAGGDVDTLVVDARTAVATPAIVRAAREQYPSLSVLLLTDYEVDDDAGVAISDVVEFVDAVDGAEETFAGWVANAVVSDGASGPADRIDHANRERHEEIVREVRHRLVDATSPRDFEAAVCDVLTVGDRYRFAWIGEYDRGEQQVVPWVTGAAVDDWPTRTTFGVGRGPETIVERALRSHELQVAEGFDPDDPSVPWAETAVHDGSTATAVVPLIDADDDELLGVMGVYTDDPAGFDDFERRAIEDVADATAHALGTMALRGEAKQQERVLRRYERLVETVGDGMYALDADGHFMTVNNGLVEMTGYTREGLLGEHVSLVVDGRFDDGSDDRNGVPPGADAIERLVSDRPTGPETMEVRLRRKDGERIPCEAKVGGLWEDDRYRGSVGVLRDITERKRQERELRRQNERLDAFASIVSHDLRNPLGVAQGYVDVLDEMEDLEQLEHVGASLDRMEAIIQDVLELARRGGTAAETEPVSLEDVVEDAWGNVETKAATLEVEESATIAADRSRFLRFLENLFRNAIEHGGEDVRVRVGLTDDPTTDGTRDDTLGFYVADDGEGVPPSVRDHLFDSEFSTSETGLGIGLWVVKEVSSAHDWTTNATESESGGARFEFENVTRA